MADMVRKQIYIEVRQQLALQQRSEATGLSESELVRQAIDRDLYRADMSTRPDPSAWAKARKFIQELRHKNALKGEAYQFDREEIYEERTGRYASNSD
jgi:hypothetical protein